MTVDEFIYLLRRPKGTKGYSIEIRQGNVKLIKGANVTLLAPYLNAEVKSIMIPKTEYYGDIIIEIEGEAPNVQVW